MLLLILLLVSIPVTLDVQNAYTLTDHCCRELGPTQDPYRPDGEMKE